MKHVLLSTAAAALMTLGSYAQAQDLKMSHVRPQDATIDVELRAFSAAVDEATGGDVKINLFPASALGDYTTVQERISVGAIDMATQPAAAAADRRMQISSFPYLAGNWEQARAVYGPAGVVRETMAGLYAEQDITMLAAYPVYFGGIALNVENPNPGSVESNGIKVRVPGIKSFQLTGEVWYMIISNESLAELSEEDQAALKEQAAAFEATRWEVAEADQGKNEQRLVDDLGATVAELTEEDLAAMAAIAREKIWPAVLEDVGVEWGQAILDQVAASGN